MSDQTDRLTVSVSKKIVANYQSIGVDIGLTRSLPEGMTCEQLHREMTREVLGYAEQAQRAALQVLGLPGFKP